MAATTVVCVTGMHRCGTSFVAGALGELGVSLGDPDLFMPAGRDNPAGYQEVRSITELDDGLLAHLGGAWDQPPVLEPGWEDDPGLDAMRVRAAEILDETFGSADARPSLIAWKDPRLSLLLPFWRTVIPIATTIVPLRDPVEVAASLGARKYRVESPQAAGLWLRYVVAAAASDPGHHVVRYRDCFEDLAGTLAGIARHLDLPPPDASRVASVRGQLDPSLRHQKTSETADAALDVENPLMALATAVWNDGDLDLDAVPPAVSEVIAQGWFRAPADSDQLEQARAEVVTITQTARRLNRELRELRARVQDDG